jgi:hypothetical protein
MDRDRLLEVNVGEGAPGGVEPERITGGGVRERPGRITGGGVRGTGDRITGGGVREFPQPSMSPEIRQRVQAAVSFHIGGKLPGIEWTSAVDPITDRFIELAAGNPLLVAAVEEDVNAMFALTDMDSAERVMRGEPVSQFGDIWDAIAEVAWEVGATDLAARIEADRADAVKGTFDALTHVEALGFGLPDDPESLSRFGRVVPDTVKAQTFRSLFDVPGAWSYSPGSGILAVTVRRVELLSVERCHAHT